MVRTLVGAVVAAVLGALVGAGSLALAYRHAPGVELPLGQPLPQVLTGFYGLERSGELTFAWTGPQATVNLPGLDRQVPWRCTIRLRGGRAAGVTQPTVAVDIDGVPGVRRLATNLFEDVVIDVPTRPARDGLTVTIASAPTFVPGPNDRRELGVQVDYVFCAPADGVACRRDRRLSPRPPQRRVSPSPSSCWAPRGGWRWSQPPRRRRAGAGCGDRGCASTRAISIACRGWPF